MDITGTTFIEFVLNDPDTEEAFLAWWREAVRHLTDRSRATATQLHVVARGHYLAMVGFPLPGTWKLVEADRRWKDLERRRPRAKLDVVHTR